MVSQKVSAEAGVGTWGKKKLPQARRGGKRRVEKRKGGESLLKAEKLHEANTARCRARAGEGDKARGTILGNVAGPSGRE